MNRFYFREMFRMNKRLFFGFVGGIIFIYDSSVLKNKNNNIVIHFSDIFKIKKKKLIRDGGGHWSGWDISDLKQ